MHKVDLSKYNLRTDLIIEEDSREYINDSYTTNDIKVDRISLDAKNILKKKKGNYVTISFDDVTDEDAYRKVLNVLIDELKKILEETKIKKDAVGLIVGLGNKSSTPDSLGYQVVSNLVVTRHLFLLGDVDDKYRNIACIEPNVMGNTGIESKDIILGIVDKIKPDFIIAIDSLCASSIERINKTIQITNTGIHPGSGIGNNRTELSMETLNIPVIGIGVPTVVTSAVIVNDTINYLMQKISYHKNNMHSQKEKLAFGHNINYLNQKKENNLTNEEKVDLLGIIGTLSEDEVKELIYEVLNPIGFNLIVTTKEIDFLIEKLGSLIGEGLNNSLHYF